MQNNCGWWGYHLVGFCVTGSLRGPIVLELHPVSEKKRGGRGRAEELEERR